MRWGCLHQDITGQEQDFLIHDNYRAGRKGRPLPIPQATAGAISRQQEPIRSDFSSTAAFSNVSMRPRQLLLRRGQSRPSVGPHCKPSRPTRTAARALRSMTGDLIVPFRRAEPGRRTRDGTVRRRRAPRPERANAVAPVGRRAPVCCARSTAALRRLRGCAHKVRCSGPEPAADRKCSAPRADDGPPVDLKRRGTGGWCREAPPAGRIQCARFLFTAVAWFRTAGRAVRVRRRRGAGRSRAGRRRSGPGWSTG